jgi:EAL domain-containing protein (putative c-di-GMP-specific phosphodiesterase class I)
VAGLGALEETVLAALCDGRLPLAYQPVVHAVSGEVAYFECLLRMRDESGELVAGSEFIPAIEQLGGIEPIDRYVLAQAVGQLCRHPELRLGINVSGLTVLDPEWLRAATRLLRDTPDLARRLVVEITETVALNDLAGSARFIGALREAGCRVALDDFGAGHTSLRHLSTLPFDIVKLDGSFVRSLAGSPDNCVFLRHLLAFAEGLGSRTVAEAVESAEEARLLRAEGVGYLQGHHFGPPVIDPPWLAGGPEAAATAVSRGGRARSPRAVV